MLNNIKIRLATQDDSGSILHIYAPYIENTAITFEYNVPTLTEFKERMANIQRMYPWLVCEINGHIAGYAYASRFKERESYKWSVDFSVYIDPEYHRRNIGKALYSALFELLKLQGFYNATAAVTMNNVKSESLHESFGFKTAGIYHNVGYKLGSWHDVKFYELKIREHDNSPAEPRPITEIINTDEFKDIVCKAEQMIKR